LRLLIDPEAAAASIVKYRITLHDVASTDQQRAMVSFLALFCLMDGRFARLDQSTSEGLSEPL
jgi:hypothetical protein